MGNQEKGKLGENAACDFLERCNYEIIERNWRASYAEVDIIAKYESQLIFIEVKTRSYDYYGQPEEFVTKKQQDNLSFAASKYMIDSNYEGEFRFDIIAIILQNGQVNKVKHIEDAFFPGLS